MSHLNIVTHCASTASGISLEHLFADNAMIRSIYCFHIVSKTQKILNTLGVRLPYIEEFDPFKSHYNLESYWKLCNDFDIHPSTDWRYKYDEKRFIQDGKTGHSVIANTALEWIQNHSCGLTQIGVQKFSESKRAYVFLILISHLSA